MLGTWVLATALAGSLGCMLALAHPLTILSGLVAGPIGAIHPLIATGWLTGLVEASLRRPRVHDFEAISEQGITLGGLYGNRVTRILLVALLTNVTVALGNVLGGALMWKVVA